MCILLPSFTQETCITAPFMCHCSRCGGTDMSRTQILGRPGSLLRPHQPPTMNMPCLALASCTEACNLVTSWRLTCSLVSSHKHIRSCHAAHSQDADNDADEMHSLVPDQQEEPGEQNHNRDHKTVQELLGGREAKNRSSRGKFPCNREKWLSALESVFPLNLSFCADPELMQLKQTLQQMQISFNEHPPSIEGKGSQWIHRLVVQILLFLLRLLPSSSAPQPTPLNTSWEERIRPATLDGPTTIKVTLGMGGDVL